jgi:hypothetical protein
LTHFVSGNVGGKGTMSRLSPTASLLAREDRDNIVCRMSQLHSDSALPH